jgi:hypothetical protein
MPTTPTNSTFADRALEFLKNLQIKAKIPPSIEVLNPYRDAYTMDLCHSFYKKYYDDNKKRTLLVGINPGRFGSGSTGISFTDPIKLETICGIPNNLTKKPELSADFIYAMIEAYGGAKTFYKKHFISAVSPLGFTSEGKNINYYDDKSLQTAITPFVEQSISAMLTLGIDNAKCFCIGEGKNLDYLTRLNDKHHWFKKIVPLSHPRFIMQYKRKKLTEYIDDYLTKLTS